MKDQTLRPVKILAVRTQDKDEDDIDSTQLFKSVERDSSINNLEYNNEGISDLNDIDPTQS